MHMHPHAYATRVLEMTRKRKLYQHAMRFACGLRFRRGKVNIRDDRVYLEHW